MPDGLAGSLVVLMLGLTAGPLSAEERKTTTYAAKLVAMTTAARPDLLVVALHVTPPSSADNIIIASNVPKLAEKKSDDDDLQVMNTNEPLAIPSSVPGRFEVLVPLRDVAGKTIGTLGLIFPSEAGDQKAKFLADGTRIRDDLQQVIPSLETLFQPFFVTAAATDNLAMHLTMKTLARHPDLWVLAFHVRPPGDSVNRVIAINFPKLLGEASEPIEEELAVNGDTNLHAIPKTHRMETHVGLRATDGRLVGTLATVYLWHKEKDIADRLTRTMAIRDELQSEILSLAALVAPPPRR